MCANFPTSRRTGAPSETAQLYLNRHKIPVIWDIDTRALVRHIRKVGALRGMVSTDGTPADQLIHEAKQLPRYGRPELAGRVSCQKAYEWEKGFDRFGVFTLG